MSGRILGIKEKNCEDHKINLREKELQLSFQYLNLHQCQSVTQLI